MDMEGPPLDSREGVLIQSQSQRLDLSLVGPLSGFSSGKHSRLRRDP